ncbi:TPA: hypothetical protein JBD37_03265 [Legionella pneumophila subsp. pneumophila]|uniref:Uncharacterized protein n=6 Tax=Legionella TaxID=445 RepID=A0A222P363_9GAMM|nr:MULTISPECIES: hypothetical protein [Legionella]ERH42116.1 hypothetical protein N751_02235 [Legionella pneumophila str. Leg01/11]ERH44614.1 hypothetical protein N750_08210 [Legionella pneumophila str. Leg01/53]ERI47370.1 hypothetical protein N749_13970 [Legionella pneumophila str. Leg01/20]AGH54321.1 hypothetical protein LPE509_02230 [Legionella pneumophila subsp. pneumophila LPE509]AMV13724.1 hypothetical protein ULM_10410 [Legionella pneumophila]
MNLVHQITPTVAQEKVNFVILIPNSDETVLSDFILREEDVPYNEQPSHYQFKKWSAWCSAHFASYYYYIKYKNALLRCKQFLYDFGPLSTLDHAALYDHWVWEMKPYVLNQENICWIGYDYSKSRALCFLSHGTNIELRLLEGDLSDEEFLELGNFFSPISSSIEILKKNFFELSYWSRYNNCLESACINRNKYKPPSSLWNLRWPIHNILRGSKPDCDIKYIKDLDFDFIPDSQIIYGSEDAIEEIQFVMFPKNGKKNQIAWFRILNKDTFPIKKPTLSRLPSMNSYSGYSNFGLTVLKTKRHELTSNIYIASFSNHYGPHDALWWDSEYAYLLQISAGVNTTIDFFKEIFSNF